MGDRKCLRDNSIGRTPAAEAALIFQSLTARLMVRLRSPQETCPTNLAVFHTRCKRDLLKISRRHTQWGAPLLDGSDALRLRAGLHHVHDASAGRRLVLAFGWERAIDGEIVSAG